MSPSLEVLLFPCDESIRVLHHWQESQTLFFIVESASTSAACSVCGLLSHRPHSRYMRRIRDLQVSAHDIQIEFISRKWFCDQTTCLRKVFTERFSWLNTYQRNTNRLEMMIEKIAFSTNCLKLRKRSYMQPCHPNRDRDRMCFLRLNLTLSTRAAGKPITYEYKMKRNIGRVYKGLNSST